jgi:hypothetical protein
MESLLSLEGEEGSGGNDGCKRHRTKRNPRRQKYMTWISCIRGASRNGLCISLSINALDRRMPGNAAFPVGKATAGDARRRRRRGARREARGARREARGAGDAMRCEAQAMRCEAQAQAQAQAQAMRGDARRRRCEAQAMRGAGAGAGEAQARRRRRRRRCEARDHR